MISKTEAEGSARAQSYSPGTSDISKKSSDGETFDGLREVQVTPLHHTNNNSGSSELLHISDQTLDIPRTDSKYHSSLRNPDFLDLIGSLEASGVEYPTESESQVVQDTQYSGRLETIQSSNLAASTDLKLTEDSSSSASELLQFEVFRFERAFEDGSSTTFSALVAKPSTDSGATSTFPEERLKLIAKILAEYKRRSILRSVALDPHGDPPDREGHNMKSQFTPDYSDGELVLAPGKSPTDTKTWDLGFNSRKFARSMRAFPNQLPAIVRYKVYGNHIMFEAFLQKEHRHAREKSAWNMISQMLNPLFYQAPLAPGFEKLANDFFSGKEVRSNYEYESGTDSILIQNDVDASGNTKNYAIAYNAGDFTAHERGKFLHDEAFTVFLQDLVMCNELENAKVSGRSYYGTRVGDPVEDSDISSLLAALVELQKKPSGMAEGDTNGTLDNWRIIRVNNKDSTDAKQVGNTVVSRSKSEVTSVGQPQSNRNAEQKSKNKKNSEDDDNWMNSKDDTKTHKAFKTGNSSKKSSKKGGRPISTRSVPATCTNIAGPDEESKVPEEIEIIANLPISQNQIGSDNPTIDQREDGSWSIVQSKSTHKSRGPTKRSSHSSIENSPRQPGPKYDQKRRPQSMFPNGSQTQLQIRQAPNTSMPKKAGAQNPLVTPDSTSERSPRFIKSQKKNLDQVEKTSHKESKMSRIFNPEDYPAFSSKMSTPSTPINVSSDNDTASLKTATATKCKTSSKIHDLTISVMCSSENCCMANSASFGLQTLDCRKESLEEDVSIPIQNFSKSTSADFASLKIQHNNPQSDSICSESKDEVFRGESADKSISSVSQPLLGLNGIRSAPDVESPELTPRAKLLDDGQSDNFMEISVLETVDDGTHGEDCVIVDHEASRDTSTSGIENHAPQPELENRLRCLSRPASIGAAHGDLSTRNSPSTATERYGSGTVVGNPLTSTELIRGTPHVTGEDSSGSISDASLQPPDITASNCAPIQDALAPSSTTQCGEIVSPLGSFFSIRIRPEKILNYVYHSSGSDSQEFGLHSEEQYDMATVSDAAGNPRTSNPALNDCTPPQQPANCVETVIAENAVFDSPQCHYPCPQLGIPRHPPVSGPGFPNAALVSNLYPHPPILGNRFQSLPRAANTIFNPGSVENLQLSLQRDWNGQQLEGIHNGDMLINSEKNRDLIQIDAGEPIRQNQPQFTTNCTYCNEQPDLSVQTPQVLCSGCGPTGRVRYCSLACLLADAYNHSSYCMNYPASDRAAFHNFPGRFIYMQNPITPLFGYAETAERFRQKAFSMYCYSGPFPRLFMAWAKKSNVVQSTHNCDVRETVKRTGDYTVFRSSTTSPKPRNNPDCDVIFTIKLHKDDPKKQFLNRALNACFLVHDKRIVKFLFRLICSLILDPESFEIFKYTEPVHIVYAEFVNQFTREFEFDNIMYMSDWEHFDVFAEWSGISHLVTYLEFRYPTLLYWSRC